MVRFYEKAEDVLLKFAVILAKHHGKYVFCKHKERSTWEMPGGHREAGETIEEASRRELREETGAVDFEIRPVCVYSVKTDGEAESFGILYFADIRSLEPELHREIERIMLTDRYPEHWTYPEIQPELFSEAKRRGFGRTETEGHYE